MRALGITLCLILLVGGQALAGQRCENCPRDKNGEIKRSTAERDAFKRENPPPEKCQPPEKCIVDHVDPLSTGGKDHRGNMQWQTPEEAKAKDKCERQGCR
jgi:hypothetical protein